MQIKTNFETELKAEKSQHVFDRGLNTFLFYFRPQKGQINLLKLHTKFKLPLKSQNNKVLFRFNCGLKSSVFFFREN